MSLQSDETEIECETPASWLSEFVADDDVEVLFATRFEDEEPNPL